MLTVSPHLPTPRDDFSIVWMRIDGMNSDSACCDELFSHFTFQDIRTAKPPERKGVYIIKVKQRGTPIAEILQQVRIVVECLNWPQVGKKVLNRVGRLQKIDSCPVIYIGAAGTQQESRRTLKGRYADFSSRHTVMYPLWALLYFGWELEYGWVETEKPAELEEALKQGYRQVHRGKLPALTDK